MGRGSADHDSADPRVAPSGKEEQDMSDTDPASQAARRSGLREQARQPAGTAQREAGPADSWFDRRAFLCRTALAGAAAGSLGTLLSACGTGAASGAGSQDVFGSHPEYRFVFVNHATASPFFTPTRYGIEDACGLLGCSHEWTGSQSASVSQMVDALDAAVAGGADGIAVSLIDPHAFDAPVRAALSKGIPVVAYNADAPGNPRLSYTGQNPQVAGERVGERIVRTVGSGDVALFIATPGSANLQPRIEGMERAIQDSGRPIVMRTVVTGTAPAGALSTIEAYWLGHTATKGMYALDGGSTEALARVMHKHGLAAKGVKAGGFDLTETTLRLVHEGDIDFTIDQQPYQQGFLPVLQLFFWRVSGMLSGIAETDTGLTFVDKDAITAYLRSSTRYEGTSATPKVVRIPPGTVA
jgi:simple sugar transport system substrate-binding protein